MSISPFSLQHDWSVNWTRIPSSIRVDPRINIHSINERKALEAIASVGLIGRNQLIRLFRLTKKEINAMEKTHKIIRHEIIKNNSVVTPIYTLGIKGALALELEDYEVNYWVEYFSDDILKCLLFFQVYHFFPKLSVIATPSPFTGAVQNKNNLIYVYVAKGDQDDLMRYLKWQKQSGHRLMLIVENFNQLKPLELYFDELKIRVVLEKDLISETNLKKDIFYQYRDGRLSR